MKKRFSWMLLSVTACAAFLIPSATPKAQSAPHRIEVTAKRFSYEPAEITVKKGEPVTLVIKSTDVAHGLRIRELNVNATIKSGGSAELNFTPAQTGDFVGHCSVFCGSGHGSMTLTVHVVN